MFLHICKGKEKLEKRRKEHTKDEKKTIVLIEGGVQIGVCVCGCVCMPVLHITVLKSQVIKQTGNKVTSLLHKLLYGTYTFRANHIIRYSILMLSSTKLFQIYFVGPLRLEKCFYMK